MCAFFKHGVHGILFPLVLNCLILSTVPTTSRLYITCAQHELLNTYDKCSVKPGENGTAHENYPFT